MCKYFGNFFQKKFLVKKFLKNLFITKTFVFYRVGPTTKKKSEKDISPAHSIESIIVRTNPFNYISFFVFPLGYIRTMFFSIRKSFFIVLGKVFRFFFGIEEIKCVIKFWHNVTSYRLNCYY